MATSSISLRKGFRQQAVHLKLNEGVLHEGFEHIYKFVREFEKYHCVEEEGVTDSVEGTAEIQTKDGEGDIFLECKISDVLDCSSRKLNTSVGSISILLFIDYKG